MTEQLDRYFTLVEREDPYARPGNLRFSLSLLFKDVDLAGKSVLDIGAGNGEVSLFAVCAGATDVVALEPEDAGSQGGMRSRFGRWAQELGVADRVDLQAVTFQGYDAGSRQFDVLVLAASINHLDEEACITLAGDPASRESYGRIFDKLAAVAAPGAKLVITDSARRNLLGDIGVRNPLAPTIEWHKHQQPRLWASLLKEHGFRDPRVRWLAPNSLRSAGQLVLGNAVAAYLMHSVFALTMTRA